MGFNSAFKGLKLLLLHADFGKQSNRIPGEERLLLPVTASYRPATGAGL